MQSVRTRGEHTKLIIRDLSSKHGVFVDNERIEPAKDTEVVIDAANTWTVKEKRHVAGRGYGGFVDVIVGEKTSFRLERVDWSLCSQGLSAQAKVGIVTTAVEIDCKMEEAWTSGISTHLIVGRTKRSEKMFLALAEGGHLVGVDWLKAAETSFRESWSSKGQKDARTLEVDHPAPVPAILQCLDIQWTPNATRKALLKDYRFISIAASKYSGLSHVIQCAGGSWATADAANALHLIRECIFATIIPVFLRPPGEGDVAKAYPKLDTTLTRMKYRWVHEDEIGMAIMYASTDMYCNPKYLEPLPAMETAGSFQNSLISPSLTEPLHITDVAALPSSSVAVPLSAAVTALSRSGSSTGDTKDDPQIVDDDDDEPPIASFSLSQMIPASTKPNHTGTSTLGVGSETLSAPQPSNPKATEKPAKKKTKMDRMALFFDGLEDEDDAMILNAVEPKSDKPILLPTANDTPSLPIPVAAAWPEKQGQSGNQLGINVHDGTGRPIAIGDDAVQNALEPREAEMEGDLKKPSPDEPRRVGLIKENEDTKLELIFQSSSPSTSAKGSRKKPSSFDAVREDMVALKLNVKVGRQKDNLDEQERLRRLEAQRLLERSKGEESKLMQSEWSEALLAKSKRRRIKEEQDQTPQGSLATEPSQEPDHQSVSVRILEAADQKNWPERWKNLPNFKDRTEVDTVLHEKWKNSTMTGLHVEPRKPASLTLDGNIEVKQEETGQKAGRYLKQEPQNSSATSPVPVPALGQRRKPISEVQRTRNDLKALLAED
ncbi:hypothetical protein BC939DRAFT_504085 [Gamsiella multidivaricata]|uniref:uncharacterized protein n=1 Tax=Gamsiella multidivaricata TaxID=101098 RepID=UPI00221E92DD|nr:uncharacterized protein BC939DRAFT_504085 [Gamsiella multidivaricata]KAG0369791.1 hypothetical protein BGZ54_008880 [Gamsiella multidivaricata]KAI7822045.1 hypothetical protein BC939DRAFT_504085 [Gamsiella multidivaricata]